MGLWWDFKGCWRVFRLRRELGKLEGSALLFSSVLRSREMKRQAMGRKGGMGA